MTGYYATGPQKRVIMHNDQIVGFTLSTVMTDQIVQALTAYQRVHICTICATRRDRYRVGRSLGLTVYHMFGNRPSKNDSLVGIMETRGLGETVAAALNQQYHHQ